MVTLREKQFNLDRVKGYVLDRATSKYTASIKVNNRTIYLGTYTSEADASTAYKHAKNRYYNTQEK